MPEARPEGQPVTTAAWFLHSEAKEPLGVVFRGREDAIPSVGSRLLDGAGWRTAEVVAFEELRPTCGARRFRVVVRVLA